MGRGQVYGLALGWMLTLGAAVFQNAGDAEAHAMLADFDYPYPVRHFEFASQGQTLTMAYLDVAPEAPNGRTVVLLHGKNFCAATWEATISALTDEGYRVVAPDQIGFCKSSKPRSYQFGLHQLAANTKALLDAIGVETPIVMGHSMGGMLAARYALMYGAETAGLVLVNPIGLEDWKVKGVPAMTVDMLYAAELNKSAEGLKAYQRSTYYAGEWRPEYDRWVDMLMSMYEGEGREIVAWNQALTADMILMQPVVYEFPNIRVPTLLLIGERDTTAIGKALAPADMRDRLGDYPELALKTARRIPGSILVTFPEAGHSPHIQTPDKFHRVLLLHLERIAGP